MSTSSRFVRERIGRDNPLFSMSRVTIETAFYGNNVVPVVSPSEAYKLAKNSAGTIVTDLPVYKPEKAGLESDSKVLLFNDGAVTGRCASARRIVGEPGVNETEYGAKLREAVYNTRNRKMYHAQAYIGLDRDFMVKAHLLVPETHENLIYNWLLNFQPINEFYNEMYESSERCENEGDIFVFSDPEWHHPDHPLGLSFFDPEHNCAAILGMRYFGEFKKGTLTLAWGCANRHGFAACHGGQKRYNLQDRKFVVGFFGLSGSGKSTLTHAKHDGKYDVTVLHDDAFVISSSDGSSVALEPSYFDKTSDYPLSSEDNKFLLSVQNVGATQDDEGRIVIVTEDIRNGNGRAIKSKIWSPNRVDKFDEPVDAIIWLMKDPSIPPVVKVNDPVLASVMGATLATKRTSAERLAPGVDPNALVIEPYANPFRTYPLSDDFNRFIELFTHRGIKCYIFNTGHFGEKKVPKELTLQILESIVENRAEFLPWDPFKELEIMFIEGFLPDLSDESYKKLLKERLVDRYNFLRSREVERGGFDRLPQEAVESISSLIKMVE
ncbi:MULTISPECIES: phosphoenolpyruvate carboxykinase (ATP) [Mesotoga]|uniref:phosphoenolpyruvate carboxykinase (ATP) n=1 Tax=Mesotoga TaxID=1184396 RepID=UPI002C7B61EA|nr:phosphoenolpyruvate carboxykinase (ATP) [Mesotoga prima]HNQ70665.1 phosphoenolpyruvate carboxykinase (ATP) [Mesotoga prima]HNS75716.1 phosphoenolpyruvate carboxykinase (ATP) [Mesotoga prima]HOP37471.1 phosphoenolpyruvate carboxykinase (ATP) [Mesotoga prima]HOZ99697.1 phosphoenolpyruvate carboxykinase (ATP) [Mesotoga prima]HPE53258.1 phosphoenolpyruvate carboxykinase (ATP) [Mesotoga prima]